MTIRNLLGRTTPWLACVGLLAAACTGMIDGAQDPAGDGDPAGPSRSLFDPATPGSIALADDVLGVELSVPARWQVVRDPYLFETHGFVLAEASETDETHGPVPVARVALDYDASPDDLEARVAEKRAEFPGVELEAQELDVGGRRAIALGPLPGGQPSIAVFLATDDALYRVHYYAESIDARGADLLAHLRFVPRGRAVAELALLPASSPLALFGDVAPRKNEPREEGEATAGLIALGDGWNEFAMGDGCWGQPSDLFLQTTHSRDANGSGWSRMGTPNFFGDNTHGNWGLGRCASGFYTNDLYAIDYYLRPGDRLYSPMADGYVTYAGWDPEGWWNYGKMVVIVSPNGKYFSLSAHLSYVNVVPGQRVNANTLIGWAGSTGYAAPYPHVHQAYYRFAQTSRGRPYGGRGMMPTRLRYLGAGGGAYTSFWQGRWASW